MKSKIIYISGGEVFEMAEIRAAFKEVRATLGLTQDTVLFGVPVDSDNAIITPQDSDTQHTENVIATVQANIVADTEPAALPAAETDVVTADTITATLPETESAPVKKPRTRTRRAVQKSDTVTDTAADATVPDTVSAPVIPILSVLAAKKSDIDSGDTPAASAPVDAQPIPEIVTVNEPDDAMAEQSGDENSNSDNDDNDDDLTPAAETAPIVPDAADTAAEIDDMDVEQSVIDDMMNDDAPAPDTEKTLEQLLESMTPLREDLTTPAPGTPNPISELDDSDATLEQLAAEFAENQDKIINTPMPESHGKIGKLKNILPFKKARHDDGGLMGDLFGWAGVAANDDDFAIPGFFTTTASKK